jgi:hypothetical protein
MFKGEQIKTMLLLLCLVVLAYSFGFSVGEYAERSSQAMRDARRIISELDKFVKGDSK